MRARDRDLVELLAWTGARVGEVAALKVRDYDGAHLSISGRDERRDRRGKVRPRLWPVLGELRPILDRLTRGRAPDEDLVEGLPRDCADLADRVLGRACAAASVERFTAHGLRRLVAVELLEQPGSEPRSVAELTGHSVAVLLRSYVRPSSTRLRDLVHGAHARRGQVVQLRAHGSGTGPGDEE